MQTTQTAQQVVRDLFQAYMADPGQMPQGHMDRFDRFDGIDSSQAAGARPERVVADYIAGMTDRFAAREHERLKGRVAFPV